MVFCEKCFSVCCGLKEQNSGEPVWKVKKILERGDVLRELQSGKLRYPLKMVAFNRNLLFQGSIFRGYVSFMQGRGEGSLLVSGNALSKFSRCKVTNWRFLWLKFAQISGGELNSFEKVTGRDASSGKILVSHQPPKNIRSASFFYHYFF